MEWDTLLFSLGFFAFCGGLIDAAVGGGGLIQLPALLHAFPSASLATVFGTNKMVAFAGTFSSVFGYVRKIKIVWVLMLPTMISAFICAFCGAMLVDYIPKDQMRYIIFFLLIFIAIYTFKKKNFGRVHTVLQCGKKEIALGVLLGGLIGFYDGIFGPGTGSFLIFLFIKVFAFDFLNASASAKLVNLGTMCAALLYFVPAGHIILQAGLILAVCNMLGGLTGAALALRYGSGFIRIFFLILLVFLIGRMGMSIFIP
ncbi:TSUP family transporter [Acinetobacter chinensis]|uniref:Probable membrane transporter protein n=1 Tax=Acinetobacter chinensis TaxID=2004650 RepID=A0ABU3WIB2_9GAMM|nr:TSUP family transporter [Acinetobacter chinensis]MDV2470158.1 TSUP family transporter [Acinetobacter chinensis]